MAKEEKREMKKGEKKPKKHLHSIRTEQAEDGSFVHHHTYKAKKEDAHTEPERQNVATSDNPEEAGQHVAEQFAMNQGQQGEPEEGGEAPEQGGGAPDAGAGAGAAPAGM